MKLEKLNVVINIEDDREIRRFKEMGYKETKATEEVEEKVEEKIEEIEATEEAEEKIKAKKKASKK